jgi:hypothetical protein
VKAIRAPALLALLGVVAAGCGHATKKGVVASITNGGPINTTGTVRPGLIVLDRRIGPVSFGEPKPEITKVVGGSVVARIDGHPLRFYPGVGIYVDYPPNPPKGKPTIADFVITRSARYKTRSGVGVGSTVRQLSTPRQGEVLRGHRRFGARHLPTRKDEHQPALHGVQHRPHDEARHASCSRPWRRLISATQVGERPLTRPSAYFVP